MRQLLDQLQHTVSAWPGVAAAPHRFGGIEFRLGTAEIGHYHTNGMVDIPFNTRLRTQLIAERRAQPHHLLPETGWISYYLRAEADLAGAVWLFRLAYVFTAARPKSRAVLPALDLPAELAALNASQPLQAAFGALADDRPE